MKNEKEQLKAWYDSPSSIINLLILFTVIIIVLSQAFAVNNSLSAEEIFRSLLNHNILYLIGLICNRIIEIKDDGTIIDRRLTFDEYFNQ